jgi:hypothetical protein
MFLLRDRRVQVVAFDLSHQAVISLPIIHRLQGESRISAAAALPSRGRGSRSICATDNAQHAPPDQAARAEHAARDDIRG